MSIEGLLAGIIILSIAAAWVGLPFWQKSVVTINDDLTLQKQRERLLIVYERVLNNIRDLDEDHSTGKMPDADYAAERETWVQRGIQVLKTLDNLGVQRLTPSADAEEIDLAIDRKIEEAVAAYRVKVNS